MTQVYRSRTRQAIGLSGPWTGPEPAPFVRGVYGAGDFVVAVVVGGQRFDRLPPDPIQGTPRESVDAMVARVAAITGASSVFELAYDDSIDA